MADETVVIEDASVSEQSPKKGLLGGTLMTVGGVAAGVAIGASVGLFVIGPRIAPASPVHQTAAATPPSVGDEGEGSSHAPPPIYLMENIVINPANSGGSRFLLITVGLAGRDEAAVAQLKARDAELRDNILRLFGVKTIDQLADISARDGLRKELNDQINKIVGPGLVRRVYFPQFVIQ